MGSKEWWGVFDGIKMHRLSNIALALNMGSVVPFCFSLQIEPLLDLSRNHSGVVVGWEIRGVTTSNELRVADGNKDALFGLTGAGDGAMKVSSKHPVHVTFCLLCL